MIHRRTIRSMTVAVAAVGSILVAACGASSGDATSTTSGSSTDQGSTDQGTSGSETKELIDFGVGVVKFGSAIALYVGVDQGFFAEEGLNVKPDVLATGPDLVASVVGGTNKAALANPVSTIQAIATGVPIQIIAPCSYINPGEKGKYGEQGLWVAPESDIKSPTDLVGKKIGIISVKNSSELQIETYLDENYGIPAGSVTYVSIPLADTPAAIKSGRVDAGVLAEPYSTQSYENGFKLLFDPNDALRTSDNDFALANDWFSSNDTIAKSPDEIDAFKRGLAKAEEYVNNNPDAARKMLSTITKLAPDLAAKVVVSKFDPNLSVDAVQRIADLMQKYGFIDKKVDMSTAIYEG